MIPGFEPNLVSEATKNLVDTEIIDMDMDGDMDVVVALHGDNKVSWLEKRRSE